MDKEFLRRQVEARTPIREIARISGKGASTVRYWLDKYDLVSENHRRVEWSQELLQAAVDGARTRREVLRTLGVRDTGSSYTTLEQKAKEFGVELPGSTRSSRTAQRRDGAAYARAKKAQDKQREIKQSWVCAYLSTHPCVDCGESDILVLEFDHTGDLIKEANVSRLIGGSSSLQRLQEEVAKCEVRCANCHRRKTIERLGGTYRTKFLAGVPALVPSE